MVSNQVLGARAVAGLLITSLALTACSMFRHHEAPAEAAPSSAHTLSSAPVAGPAEREMTATEAAIAAGGASAGGAGESVAAVTKENVNPNAPMH